MQKADKGGQSAACFVWHVGRLVFLCVSYGVVEATQRIFLIACQVSVHIMCDIKTRTGTARLRARATSFTCQSRQLVYKGNPVFIIGSHTRTQLPSHSRFAKSPIIGPLKSLLLSQIQSMHFHDNSAFSPPAGPISNFLWYMLRHYPQLNNRSNRYNGIPLAIEGKNL